MTITAIIIEDEIPARKTIRSYLNKYFPFVEIIAEIDSVKAANRYLKAHDADILFLDVQLKDGLGLEILEHIKNKKIRVIFTTAHDEYTFQAFHFKAFGYLLKPLDPFDFKEIMNRVVKDVNYEDPFTFKIKVPTKDGHTIIDVNEIIRCEADSNYTKVFTKKSVFVFSKTLKTVEEEFSSTQLFVRPHQSHLINYHFINKSLSNPKYLTLLDGFQVPISRSKKEILSIELEKRGIFIL